jgi:hypothetical protein
MEECEKCWERGDRERITELHALKVDYVIIEKPVTFRSTLSAE